MRRVALCLILAALACRHPELVPSQKVADGVASRAPAAIVQHGCGYCHDIPGVKGANGLLAPPLNSFAHRVFIAGQVTNTPDHLVRWIMHPDSIEAGTAMPWLGVTEGEARDIAAYLYAQE